MWDLPGPGLEHVSPALAGGFSTTAPPGKSSPVVLIATNVQCHTLAYRERSTGIRAHLIGASHPKAATVDSFTASAGSREGAGDGGWSPAGGGGHAEDSKPAAAWTSRGSAFGCTLLPGLGRRRQRVTQVTAPVPHHSLGGSAELARARREPRAKVGGIAVRAGPALGPRPMLRGSREGQGDPQCGGGEKRGAIPGEGAGTQRSGEARSDPTTSKQYHSSPRAHYTRLC